MLARLPVRGAPPQRIDLQEAARAVALLLDPDGVVELRGITPAPPGAGGKAQVESVLSTPEAVTELLPRLASSRSIYWTINPVRPDWMGPVNASAIVRRHNLLLDIDPVRPDPSHTDATEEESARSLAVAMRARSELARGGWPAPVLIGSGNGHYLLYRVDLPNDARSRALLQVLLLRLSERFSDSGATIDAKVFDAPRIMKVPGTWSQKGPGTAERPHRMCRILEVPGHA